MTEYCCLECALDGAEDDAVIIATVRNWQNSCDHDDIQECISCGEMRHVADERETDETH